MPYCQNCGHQHPDAARFCSKCGQALRQAAPAAPQPTHEQLVQPQVRHEAPPQTSGKEYLKWGGIGCGGLLGLLLIFGIIGAIIGVDSTDGTTRLTTAPTLTATAAPETPPATTAPTHTVPESKAAATADSSPR